MSGPPEGAPATPGGAARERTRFAWRRTVLTMTVVTLLAVRQALLADPPWVRALAASVVMLAWLTGLLAGHRRVAGVARGDVPIGREPLVAVSVTAVLAALGVVLLA